MPADAYTFSLAWRWTKPSHNVLPPEVMAQIIPITEAIAPPGFTASGDFDDSLVDQVQATSAEGSVEEVAKWLRLLPVAPSTRVVVRWDESTAVRTTWKAFTDYWDDFCYPSSDDVKVFPQSGEWLLLYYHWEQFQWCRGRQPNSV